MTNKPDKAHTNLELETQFIDFIAGHLGAILQEVRSVLAFM
jgi:hypothetical protein